MQLMATNDPDRRGAAFLLVQLGFLAARRFAARLEPTGLDPRRFGLLRSIESGDGRSQQELAGAVGMHASKMVGLVDELEHDGLVERHRSAGDRRAYELSLTPKGRAALAEARTAAEAHGDNLLSALDADEREELTRLLRKVADANGVDASSLPGRPPWQPR